MGDQSHRANAAVPNDLPLLLTHWRARLDPRRIPGVDGTRRRMRPGLTQKEVAHLAEASEAWYRELESGKGRRYSDDFLHRVATVLRLDEDERAVLFRLAGRGMTPWMAAPASHISGDLQTIIERMLPSPAYLSNLWWDVLLHNRPTDDDYFFWTKYEPNFMRFTFLHPEAREVFVNWRHDWAAPSLAQLRYAIVAHPECNELQSLRDEILDGSAAARELWTSARARSHSYGDVRSLRSPDGSDRQARVRITSFSPLANCNLRLVVLMLV
ncbi:helix-turn-helix transcriptional regulator [Streptomyces tsukubensis]|uniref:helix-turn-helix transcriptional regulator n=1 Tax=Streptomyces tsukubensis TaxID=83656 RepID=UPI003696EC46